MLPRLSRLVPQKRTQTVGRALIERGVQVGRRVGLIVRGEGARLRLGGPQMTPLVAVAARARTQLFLQRRVPRGATHSPVRGEKNQPRQGQGLAVGRAVCPGGKAVAVGAALRLLSVGAPVGMPKGIRVRAQGMMMRMGTWHCVCAPQMMPLVFVARATRVMVLGHRVAPRGPTHVRPAWRQPLGHTPKLSWLMELHNTRRVTKPVPAVLRMRTVHMRFAMDEGVPMVTGTGKRADPMVGWLSVTCSVVALSSTTKDPGVMPEPATDEPVKMLRVELTTMILELMANVAVVRVKQGTVVGHI